MTTEQPDNQELKEFTAICVDVCSIIASFSPAEEQELLKNVSCAFFQGASLFASYSLPLLLESLSSKQVRTLGILQRAYTRRIHNVETLGQLQELKNKAPSFYNKLQGLTFGEYFDQPLNKGDLPARLRQLTFGVLFDQPLKKGDLPASLTHLTFGKYFNQPLNLADLPANLTHLTFGEFFNQPLNKGVLPASLTHLTFGKRFNKPLKKGDLPEGLQSLVFEGSSDVIKKGVLPSSLNRLVINGKVIPIETVRKHQTKNKCIANIDRQITTINKKLSSSSTGLSGFFNKKSNRILSEQVQLLTGLKTKIESSSSPIDETIDQYLKDKKTALSLSHNQSIFTYMIKLKGAIQNAMQKYKAEDANKGQTLNSTSKYM